jgi:hypothetical protein
VSSTPLERDDAVTVVVVMNGREDQATFRAARVLRTAAHIFEYRAESVAGFCRHDQEGITWMRGHGPEIEATLRAAYVLHDGDSAPPPPRDSMLSTQIVEHHYHRVLP